MYPLYGDDVPAFAGGPLAQAGGGEDTSRPTAAPGRSTFTEQLRRASLRFDAGVEALTLAVRE